MNDFIIAIPRWVSWATEFAAAMTGFFLACIGLGAVVYVCLISEEK